VPEFSAPNAVTCRDKPHTNRTGFYPDSKGCNPQFKVDSVLRVSRVLMLPLWDSPLMAVDRGHSNCVLCSGLKVAAHGQPCLRHCPHWLPRLTFEAESSME
jgi:hypothetical protein